MLNAKAIKTKIKSISNIQKITSALEIVSTVKLQKVKEKADNFRDYMIELLYILNMINAWDLFNQHKKIKSNKELVIVISTEKGLCWALNSKLFKKVHDDLNQKNGIIDVFCVGKKALEFFTRTWYNIVGVNNLKDSFFEKDLDELRWFVVSSINNWTYKKIKIYFNYFKNTMLQIPTMLKIFPLEQKNFYQFMDTIWLDVKFQQTDKKEIIIEPSKEQFCDFVYKKFITDITYWVILQNKAWEHSSRMIAMKNAKDNSITIKQVLQISYNKQRQSSVTQEISEIVGAKTAMEE